MTTPQPAAFDDFGAHCAPASTRRRAVVDRLVRVGMAPGSRNDVQEDIRTF
jgi:hypothetical protein